MEKKKIKVRKGSLSPREVIVILAMRENKMAKQAIFNYALKFSSNVEYIEEEVKKLERD